MGGKMKKVLIVDDNADIRKLVELVVRGSGREIFQAGSGDEAVKIAREVVPDLIFMDMMMPGGIDGLGATRALKTDPKTRSCTIIAMTARDPKTDFAGGQASGVDEFLRKPFLLKELIGKTEKFLGPGGIESAAEKPGETVSGRPPDKKCIEDD
jgi:two-component system cell cycle response regulator DivK